MTSLKVKVKPRSHSRHKLNECEAKDLKRIAAVESIVLEHGMPQELHERTPWMDPQMTNKLFLYNVLALENPKSSNSATPETRTKLLFKQTIFLQHKANPTQNARPSTSPSQLHLIERSHGWCRVARVFPGGARIPSAAPPPRRWARVVPSF